MRFFSKEPAEMRLIMDSIAKIDHEIQQMLLQLGEMYYKDHKDSRLGEEKYADMINLIHKLYQNRTGFYKNKLRLEGHMMCANCGSIIAYGSMFCNVCGKRTDEIQNGATGAGSSSEGYVASGAGSSLEAMQHPGREPMQQGYAAPVAGSSPEGYAAPVAGSSPEGYAAPVAGSSPEGYEASEAEANGGFKAGDCAVPVAGSSPQSYANAGEDTRTNTDAVWYVNPGADAKEVGTGGAADYGGNALRCKNCGALLDSDSIFCTSCGQKIG